MDVQATKPVTAASSSSAPSTEKPVVVATDLPADSPPARIPVVTPAPVDEMLHTQQAIAEQVSRYLQSSTRNLEFLVEEHSGATVIVVRDAEGQVIRRIPGEEVLQLMRRLNADSGTLIDSRA